MKKLFLVLLAILGVIIAAAVINPDPPKLPTITPTEANRAKQPERQALIQKLISAGIFKAVKTSGPTTARAIVGPAFKRLSFDDKRAFVGVVAEYFRVQDPKRNFVVLIDWQTNKKVGTFSRFGLDLE